eukprot:TRINITY_DN2343_c0_g1_i2.p1 TRINITY_DN2343_c0_g1~~TRINITY_DN2343_c0_g1_i2.p1  ORF type:complete len:188 (-),score=34.87 TRINITY_DN2343_c0_g1_i2:136-699(-)
MAQLKRRSPVCLTLLAILLSTFFSCSFVVSLGTAHKPTRRSRVARNADLQPGDYVKARYHIDHNMHNAILLSIEPERGPRYVVSWDEPDEREPLSGTTDIELIKKAKTPLTGQGVHNEKQVFFVGDKVDALFYTDNGWYAADIIEKGKKGEDYWLIKWKDPDGGNPTEEKPGHELKLTKRVKNIPLY